MGWNNEATNLDYILSVGADLGARRSWNGREDVFSGMDFWGVFVSCGCLVILPGTSTPRRRVVGVDNSSRMLLPGVFLANGFNDRFYTWRRRDSPASVFISTKEGVPRRSIDCLFELAEFVGVDSWRGVEATLGAGESGGMAEWFECMVDLKRDMKSGRLRVPKEGVLQIIEGVEEGQIVMIYGRVGVWAGVCNVEEQRRRSISCRKEWISLHVIPHGRTENLLLIFFFL